MVVFVCVPCACPWPTQSAITALFVMYRQALLPASSMSSLDESVPHRVGDAMYDSHSIGGVKHEGIDVSVSAGHASVV